MIQHLFNTQNIEMTAYVIQRTYRIDFPAGGRNRSRCDYIHGEDSVRKLATSGNTGILVPAISKDTFFSTVEKEGVFPRKTFSMGEAFEKRFYLEAKKIE